ncbi:MAG: M20 family metallopeptidase [Planctomycetota bacterium]
MTATASPPGLDRDRLRDLIDEELPGLIEFRRDLHRHPEMMFEERRTASRVAASLAEAGVEHKSGIAAETPGGEGTGLIGHLAATGGSNRPAVALRADMDALPIEELTGKPYASGNPGVMHACGHDGHTTILLGTARVLSKLSDRPNPVTFVFQPAEEGGAGGEKMCRDGALAGAQGGGLGPKVGRIFGLHGWPQLPLGTVQTRPGPLLAATDDFLVTVRGVGGHAAYPHLARDPIVAASHIVTALQSLSSRTVSPVDSVVCTVGRINGGSANNVIPDTTEIEGTVRTLRGETRATAERRFKEIVSRTAEAFGCTAEIDWQPGYPVTSNDPEQVERFFRVARAAIGEERVGVAPEPGMGGEDFSYYGDHAPACFFLLGLCPDGADPAKIPQLHQPGFDFNDDAIAAGVELMVSLALDPT